MKNNDGLTLVELMVTIAIIGILALVSVPLYRDYVIRVRTTEVLIEFGPFRKELLEMFLSSEGSMASQVSQLHEDIKAENAASGITRFSTAKNINGNSLDRVEFHFLGSDSGGWLEILLHLKEGVFPAKMNGVNYFPNITYRMNYLQSYIGVDGKLVNIAKQGNGTVMMHCFVFPGHLKTALKVFRGDLVNW